MGMADEFFDFAVFWELMFGEEDEGFECPLCGAMIKKGTTLECIDAEDRTFLCPECDGSLILNEKAGTVEMYKEEKRKAEKLECPSCGRKIGEDDKVEVIDKAERVFKCPGCHANLRFDVGEDLEVVEAEEMRKLEQVIEEREKIEREVEYRKKIEEIMKEADAKGIRFPIGQLKSQDKFIVRGASIYLDLITIGLKARQKNEALAEMVALITGAGLAKDGKELYAHLRVRESLGSTGIGQGVALPHVSTKMDTADDVIAAVGISKEGFEFDTLDGEPAHIIFAVVFKETADNANSGMPLKFMALVSRFIKIKENREKMISATSREELFAFLKDNLVDKKIARGI